jgi:hypothetical protein
MMPNVLGEGFCCMRFTFCEESTGRSLHGSMQLDPDIGLRFSRSKEIHRAGRVFERQANAL